MRWRAALLMASPTADAGEAPPLLSTWFTAIHNRPVASAMMIAAPTQGPSRCRILNLQIVVTLTAGMRSRKANVASFARAPVRMGSRVAVSGTLWRLAEVIDVPVDQPRPIP